MIDCGRGEEGCMIESVRNALTDWPPLLFGLAGLMVGLFLELQGLAWVRRMLEHRWRLGESIAGALRGAVVVWLTALGCYASLLSYPLRPELRTAGERFLLVAVVGAGTVVSARLLLGFVTNYGRRHARIFPAVSIFASLTEVGVYVIGVLVILQSLGISIAPVLTALGVGGLAVALALRDTLSNFFAGIQIIASRQLEPGSYVRLESGNEGRITDITWRNTTIADLSNSLILIPNEKLASSIVVNYQLPDEPLIVSIPLAVSVRSDLGAIDAAARDIANKMISDSATAGPKAHLVQPDVRFMRMDEVKVEFIVNVQASSFLDQFRLRHQFIKLFHERCKREQLLVS